MVKSLYLAGVGGQGLQVAGKVLVEAAYKNGYKVTYSPKYGFEKRGGLTSCYVVISDEEIGNPRKKLQDILLVMEPKAYQNFHKDVKPGGSLVVNSALIKETEAPSDSILRIDIPFHEICLELGNLKVISSVVIGSMSYLLRDLFPDAQIIKEIMLESLKKKPALLELNSKAFDRGYLAANQALS